MQSKSSNSSSPFVLPVPSPTKRPRLANASSFDGPFSSSSRTVASSSKSTPVPRSGTSTAGTPFGDEEYNSARRASVHRVLSVWNTLEQRYARAIDEDDILDLRTGRLVQDCGVLKGRDRPWAIGKLLDDEDPSSSDAGEEEEEEEEEEGVTRDEDPDADKDDLLLESDVEERGQTTHEEIETAEESEDELGEWDTIPAPPTPELPEPQTDLATPDRATRGLNNPATDDALSFLYSNVRPRLERLAREREESPLPSEDLEAFMAAEASLKAQEGYVEPDADDGDEIIFLGYGQRGTETEVDDEEGVIGLDDDDDDNGDRGGEPGVNSNYDTSEDELNDWPTIPAPPSEVDSDEPENENSFGADAGEEYPNHSQADPTPLEEARKPRPRSVELSNAPSLPRAPPAKTQLPTPPYSHRSEITSICKSSSPERRVQETLVATVAIAKGKVKRKEKEKETVEEAQVDAQVQAPLGKPKPRPRPKAIFASASTSTMQTPTKSRETARTSLTTTLTPTLKRLMSQQVSPSKTSLSTVRKPRLVPEVVVPTLRSLSLSPRKKSNTERQEREDACEAPATVNPSKSVPTRIDRRPDTTEIIPLVLPRPAFEVDRAQSSKKRKRAEGDIEMQRQPADADHADDNDDTNVDFAADRMGSIHLRDNNDEESAVVDTLDVPSTSHPRSSSPEDGSGLRYDDQLGYNYSHRHYDDHRGYQSDDGAYPIQYEGNHSRDYGERQEEEEEDYSPIASSSRVDPGPPQLRRSPRRHLAKRIASSNTPRRKTPPLSPISSSYLSTELAYFPSPSNTTAQIPIALLPQPQPQPHIHPSPAQAQHPPNVLPQPPSFASGADPESLLTQVLYSLNYLAYQNAVNTAASNFATATSGSRAPHHLPAFPSPATGGIFPAAQQQVVGGYPVPLQHQLLTPIAQGLHQQQRQHASAMHLTPPSSNRTSFNDSMPPSSPRSILRNSDIPHQMAALGIPSGRNHVSRPYQDSPLSYGHREKGRGKQSGGELDVFSDGIGIVHNPRDEDWRRGQSVTFSASSSAVGEMSRRRRVLDPRDEEMHHICRRKSVPGRLHDGWDELGERGVFDEEDFLPPPTRSPNKSLDITPSRSIQPAPDVRRAPFRPHPLRDSFQPSEQPLRKALKTQRSLPNIAGERSRMASNASTTFASGSTSTVILAKARAALSHSAARTTTLNMSRSQGTK
ncbi:hypothetical protein FRB97_004416 [Tulasnella sp. 331]|nr:hypothetical protein FRB97_004416 [Tulasnella sp. 331]